MIKYRLHKNVIASVSVAISQIVIFLIFFFTANNLWCHGVEYEIVEGKSILIKVGYDDGEPMSYAEVKIFSPKNSKVEYQNGYTDKNGCFAFLPDSIGKWKIFVNDAMGHGVVTKIEVKEEMRIESKSKKWPRLQKLITGVSIIFGLTGLLFYIKVGSVR
ncbi:MAG TPA: hypothetical protein DCX95_00475 [Elusimicrobia bacterium]|nr:hypothetical protein [Elusimicrobiota bacterium]